ncbi:hypothetical protein [Neobacillus niacini]|uniref:hypothetical protein n=1 Tax=Neobacillus niacini TaxID=86668 RepID=UPI0021CB49B0|nr:hypothetical protein [Neobacillus niacini]MCM3768456.1 hypothetical protein [Neobacillus niacini]
MINRQVQFDIDTLKMIKNRLDYIYSIARKYNNDNPELMDTIEGLAVIANMFATNQLEELKGTEAPSSPQGAIVSKLGNPCSRMKEYENQKTNDFPAWKL